MVRRKTDWMNWVLHSQPSQHGNASSPSSPAAPNVDSVVDRMQSVALVDRGGNPITGATGVSAVGSSTSGNFINQLQVEDTNEGRSARVASFRDSAR